MVHSVYTSNLHVICGVGLLIWHFFNQLHFISTHSHSHTYTNNFNSNFPNESVLVGCSTLDFSSTFVPNFLTCETSQHRLKLDAIPSSLPQISCLSSSVYLHCHGIVSHQPFLKHAYCLPHKQQFKKLFF